jgi:hypothetical protein
MSDKTIRDLENVSENDPNTDYFLISQDGADRKQLFLDLEKTLFQRFIGTIHAFGQTLLPEGFLACDGSKVLINDYPQLYNAIGSTFKAHYSGDESTNPVDDASEFVLPNLQNRYLTHGQEVSQILPDTMRKITGTIYTYHQTGKDFGALYRVSDNDDGYPHRDADTSESGGWATPTIVGFDSQVGVEGQEGEQSPNVGSVTRPETVVINYAIFAKVAH